MSDSLNEQGTELTSPDHYSIPTDLILNSPKPACLEKMTIQETMFCHHYVVHFDLKKAAKAIGVSRTKATELLSNPYVREYLDWINQEYGQQAMLVTKRYVEHHLVHRFLPMAAGEIPIKKWHPDHGQVTVKETNMAAYFKAIEMAGKHAGYVEPDKSKKIPVTVNLNFSKFGIQNVDVIEGEVDEGSN